MLAEIALHLSFPFWISKLNLLTIADSILFAIKEDSLQFTFNKQ